MLKQLAKVKTRHWLGLILLLALLLRLYRLDNPVADWHAFRQADTASVTLEYVKAAHIDLLRPRYHDLSNIQSGLDNPEGYRMVEFPLINGALALALRAAPSLDLVILSRLAAILASLGTLLLIYRLGQTWFGRTAGLLSALVFAVLPYSVFYSRVILPEPFVVFFSTLAIWQFQVFLNKRHFAHYLLSALALAVAALLKPFVLFLGPVFVAILLKERGRHFYKEWPLFFYPLLAFAPMLAWREWIQQFPSGIPASDWLLNGNGIRFTPAWWRWIFYERLSKLFLGGVGLVFVFANFLRWQRPLWLLGSWWLGLFAYFAVIATGNVQHDYYQNLVLPVLSLTVGRGIVVAYSWLRRRWSAYLSLLVVLSLGLGSLCLAWFQLAGYFNVNNWHYVKAGAAADRLLPADALVIAPAMGDTHFLLQTKRRGWPIGFEIEDKIAKGAQFYVSATYDWEAKLLEEQYPVLEKTAEYIIIDLRP